MKRTQAQLAYYRRQSADPQWRERTNAAQRTGGPIGRPRIPLKERIWNYVDRTANCWNWTGAVDKDGYGQTAETIDSKTRRLKAHRAMYELLVGPIPKDKQIDHLCRNRACVNPEHLEPVDSRTNVIRGNGPRTAGNRNAAKTNCPRGHPYTDANTRTDNAGRRHCKACHG